MLYPRYDQEQDMTQNDDAWMHVNTSVKVGYLEIQMHTVGMSQCGC